MSMSTNPRIFTVDIGIKELETFTFYPIAYSYQKKFSKEISEIIGKYVADAENLEKMTIPNFIIKVLDEFDGLLVKIVKETVLDLKIQERSTILDKADNYQVYEIINKFWENNYGFLSQIPLISNLLNLVQPEVMEPTQEN